MDKNRPPDRETETEEGRCRQWTESAEGTRDRVHARDQMTTSSEAWDTNTQKYNMSPLLTQPLVFLLHVLLGWLGSKE